MTDERNDAVGRDGADSGNQGQNPPPLIPPPVRREETGEQPTAERTTPDGSDEPALVEPATRTTDTADPVFSDRDGDSARRASTPEGDGSGDRPTDPAYEERPLDSDRDAGSPLAPQTTFVADRSVTDAEVNDGNASDRDVTDRGLSVDRDVSDRDADRRDLGDRDEVPRTLDERDAAERTLEDRDRDRDRDSGARAAAVAASTSTSDRDAVTARDVEADRQAVRDTSADAEPVTVAHPSTAPDAAPAPVLVPQSQGGYEQTAAYPAAPAAQREFVEPPIEPKKRGNRGVGSLIALLSVILFAIIYSLIAAAIIASQRPQDLGEIFIAFVQNPVFWIPAIIFVVSFVIVVLLANRAAWWAYVLGSLLVGALVYFGTIGVALVLANPTTLTPDDARRLITQRAIDPFLITASLVAREVSLWTGSAIASRGRRMKARNLTARDEYERASAEHRAEYERSYSPAV